MPEVRVEGRHAVNPRRRDLRGFAHSLEGFLGQVVVLVLDRFQYGHNGFRAVAYRCDNPVYVTVVYFVAHFALPAVDAASLSMQ